MLVASPIACQDKATAPDGSARAPGRSFQPPAIAPPASEEVLRLLAPWRVGTQVQGFEVIAIHGVFEGSIWVLLRGGGGVAYLEITRAGEGPPPPFSAPPYFVYVSTRGTVQEGLLSTLAESVGAVLLANREVAVPAALEVFHRGGRMPDPPRR